MKFIRFEILEENSSKKFEKKNRDFVYLMYIKSTDKGTKPNNNEKKIQKLK